MLPISLKQEVTKALSENWPSFAQRHPRLAEAIDTDLLIEQATACLADDPDYRDAFEQASAAGLGAEALADLVRQFLRRWLAGL